MAPPPKSASRSQPKMPPAADREDARETSWVRRFWLILGIGALFSAGLIWFNLSQSEEEEIKEAYVSLAVKTTAGQDQVIICKLLLVVDAKEALALQSRSKMLEAVVARSLAEQYGGQTRPPLAQVRQRLWREINRKLPEELRVQDLLIQDFVIGVG